MSTISVVVMQKMIKDAALVSMIEDGIDEHLDNQIDNYKWVIPVVVEGETCYAELSLTAKKLDYDESNLMDDIEHFHAKQEAARIREEERAAKAAERASKAN